MFDCETEAEQLSRKRLLGRTRSQYRVPPRTTMGTISLASIELTNADAHSTENENMAVTSSSNVAPQFECLRSVIYCSDSAEKHFV